MSNQEATLLVLSSKRSDATTVADPGRTPRHLSRIAANLANRPVVLRALWQDVSADQR